MVPDRGPLTRRAPARTKATPTYALVHTNQAVKKDKATNDTPMSPSTTTVDRHPAKIQASEGKAMVLTIKRFCQLVEAETLIGRMDSLSCSFLYLKQPASSP